MMAFFSCLFLHFVLQRSGLFSSTQKNVALLCLFNALSYGAVTGEVYELACALGFSHLYFHVFNYTVTARRIRLLLSGKVEDYTPREILQNRLHRLTEMGSVCKEEGAYRAVPGVMLYAAELFNGLGRIFYSKSA